MSDYPYVPKGKLVRGNTYRIVIDDCSVDGVIEKAVYLGYDEALSRHNFDFGFLSYGVGWIAEEVAHNHFVSYF
jgi:hypothetical protein